MYICIYRDALRAQLGRHTQGRLRRLYIHIYTHIYMNVWIYRDAPCAQRIDRVLRAPGRYKQGRLRLYIHIYECVYIVTPRARSSSIASSVRLNDIKRGGSDDCIYVCIRIHINVYMYIYIYIYIYMYVCICI